MTKTVRYDGNGNLQYRFAGLQPSRFYHLDAMFYQEGENFSQAVSFDGIDSGQVFPLTSGTATNATMLVPPSAYSDGSMVVTIKRAAGAPSGPAFVSELKLTPIEYIYLDAGGASDAAYSAASGYGYLPPNNPYASTLGGGDAVSTYRSAFGSLLEYQFDHLATAKKYVLDLTLYDGAGST